MKIGKETEILEFKKTTAELKEGVISMSAARWQGYVFQHP